MSDCHKLVEKNFNSHFRRLLPDIVYYRNYANFDEKLYLNDLQRTNCELELDNPDENYLFLTETFMEIFEKHLPLKKKFIRGNQAPFMKKKTERDNLQ